MIHKTTKRLKNNKQEKIEETLKQEICFTILKNEISVFCQFLLQKNIPSNQSFPHIKICNTQTLTKLFSLKISITITT